MASHDCMVFWDKGCCGLGGLKCSGYSVHVQQARGAWQHPRHLNLALSLCTDKVHGYQ